MADERDSAHGKRWTASRRISELNPEGQNVRFAL